MSPESIDNGGRWPSNLLIGDAEAAARVDGQSGVSKSTIRRSEDRDTPGVTYALGRTGVTARGHVDEQAAGASRFFHCGDWNAETFERLHAADPLLYTAKPDRRERDSGLEALPTQKRARVNPGGLEKEPRWAPVEARNPHACVKSLKTLRHLAALLLPPAAYAPRRLLVPFCGSGSEVAAAYLAGWEEIVGVEMSPEYCEIARSRLRFWQGHSGLFLAEEAASEEAQVAQTALALEDADA